MHLYSPTVQLVLIGTCQQAYVLCMKEPAPSHTALYFLTLHILCHILHEVEVSLWLDLHILLTCISARYL